MQLQAISGDFFKYTGSLLHLYHLFPEPKVGSPALAMHPKYGQHIILSNQMFLEILSLKINHLNNLRHHLKLLFCLEEYISVS